LSILSGAAPTQTERMAPPNPIFRFQCGTAGKDCDRVHSDERRAERGVVWQPKDPQFPTNKYSRYGRDKCGSAAKVIFAENPWTNNRYSPIEGGYTRRGLIYGKEEKLEVWQTGMPKKYMADVDPSLFEDPNWMTKGGCHPEATQCNEGFNLDRWVGLCANDLKGWLPEKTPPSACSFISHKCDEKDLYYSPPKGWAFIPALKKNKKLYIEKMSVRLYKYKFAFKKWEVCSASQVSNSSKFAPSQKPSGFTCQVTKRCVCMSCTAGLNTTEAGNKVNTGEPCSCNHLPQAVDYISTKACAIY